ncbi:MAG TPA: TonB-dependent receptor [Terriglobales bacterium]|nr:TonB-dependent receptor [Terriglobales bacterium]
MSKQRWLAVLAASAVFVLVASIPMFGQAVYGSIIGTATDPQGAAVPNATVTVTNVRKGTSDTTTTNESGNYSATHLIPDVYNVRIEAKGFKTVEQKNVSVSADSAAKVDLQVQLGQASETVEVTSEAPQLKTDRADVSIQFNSRYVENLPIFNRNFTSLELASPGTQKLVGWSHAATENPQGGQQIFVNGQHFSGTAFELDGTDNQDPILGIIVVNPNLDAVTETKWDLQNYDAEFGKAVAGIMTAQTKSGSNEVHGSAFWFRRTDALQARDPFSQYKPDAITGRFIPSSRWNQFGGSLGGAIIKNKLFYFGDYQGTRQTVGQTNQLSIPTATVLNTCTQGTGFCDLSDYFGVNGGGQVYDPSTGTPDGKGRTAFAGNLIPVSRLSPQAVAILKLFPQPINGDVKNNYVASGSGPFNQNSFDVRVDYDASQSLNFFTRFSLDYFNLSGKPSLGDLGGVGTGLLGLAGSSITHNYSLASGFTKTFSPSLLMDFRFGWFKYNPQTHKWDEGTTPATTFGIPGLNLGDVATSGLPYFNMDSGPDISDFGDGLNVDRCNCPLTESEQQFQFVNNWTKVVGNHSFKFGGDIRYAMNLRIPSDANRTGQLHFNQKGTGQVGLTDGSGNKLPDGGLALATFLLGDVTSMDRYVSNPNATNAAERQKRWFFYGQDTWRITDKLTLNYGLRWEIYFPESVNGKGKGGFANIKEGVIRVGGYGPYGLNGNIDNNLHAFAPRIGMAYQFTPKTVVRMGYGRSFDIGVFGSNFGHTVTQNLPVLVNQTVNVGSQGINGTQDYATVFTIGCAPGDARPVCASPGPPTYQFPDIPSNGQLPLAGPRGDVTPKIRPTSQVLPTLDAWNVTVQRQVTPTLSVEAGYIGNHGTHSFAGNGPSYNINPPTEVGFGTIPQTQRRPFYNKFSYPGYIDPNTGTTLMCCSSDLGNYLGNDASTDYNALQVKVEKRLSQGLQFMSHYTFSHAQNYTDTYYAIDKHIARGPDDFNRNHVWVMTMLYELPFGKGKTFFSGAGKAADLVVGGWQITSTTNWSSGLPWTPSTSVCGNEEDVGVCRPDKGSGSFKMGAGSLQHNADGTPFVPFFTPEALGGAFADPGVGSLGNIGRNVFHGPHLFTSDASFMKNFDVTEKVKAQFRMDVFNLFNHPVLGFSSTQGNLCIDCVSSSDAGQIRSLEADTSMRQVQFALRFTF